jgi:ELWxxDGT repeat protein
MHSFGESKFVFAKDTEDYGEELWLSDGTEEGTHLVKDIHEGDEDSEIDNIVAVGPLEVRVHPCHNKPYCLHYIHNHRAEHPDNPWFFVLHQV